MSKSTTGASFIVKASYAIAITLSAPAIAGTILGQDYDFHFSGGSLDDGLISYGRTTGLELLYTSASVRGLSARPLEGRMSASAALGALLAKSGLQARWVSAQAVLLTIATKPGENPSAPRKIRVHPRRVSAEPKAPATAPPSGAEIIVTGSHIRGNADGPSPLAVLDKSDLDQGGRTTVADALSQLPQNFGGTATESTLLAGSDHHIDNVGAASSVNLRGLGSNATLTLIDGRRVAGSGGAADFTDLSSIPLVAVDRIEVLTDGASALYGSDAVGGVVNIKLRQQLNGAESQLRLGTVTAGGSKEIDFGQVVGKTWGGGHVLLAYEYYHRRALASGDRHFSRSDDLRPLGGSDFRTYYSVPGTILTYDPTTNNYVPAFAILAGQDGAHLTPSDFTPGANLSNQQEGTDLLPRQNRHSGFATIEQAIGPSVQIYAEGRYARRDFLYHLAPATALITVTPENPYFVSPDGSQFSLIAYSFANELGATQDTGRVISASGTLGARVSLIGNWQLDSYISRAEELTRSLRSHSVNTQRLDEALGNLPIDPTSGYDPARDGYFNPYGDGNSNSAATLAFVGSGYGITYLRSRLTTAETKADGTLLHLPGGPLRLAVGASFRREALIDGGSSFSSTDTPTIFTTAHGSRSVAAGFAELALPLFGAGNTLPGLRRLELSLAFRSEHHTDYGNTTNPKLGLVWSPISGLMLRGSYGTSFRAPSLPEINDPVEITPTQLPNSSGGYTPVLFISGGNQQLSPERAKSYSFGATILPSRLKGFEFEANAFGTHFNNRIGRPAFENILAALQSPDLSPFVTSVDPANNPADLAKVEALIADPNAHVPNFIPPQIFQAIVDSRYVNTAQVIVRGLDLSIEQRFSFLGGAATTNAHATYLIDYKERETPAARLIQHVNQVGYPASFRGEASFDWSGRVMGATLTVHHVGGYRDDLSIPQRHVSSWTTLDMQVRYTPARLAGLTFSLSVQNIANTDPPFVNRVAALGYDPANADPLGRFVSLQMRKAW